MSEIRIPPAALEAGARAMCHEAYKHLPEMRDQDTYTPDAEYWRGQARTAFVAMVEAWEGAATCLGDEDFPRKLAPHDALILPLMENSDDRA